MMVNYRRYFFESLLVLKAQTLGRGGCAGIMADQLKCLLVASNPQQYWYKIDQLTCLHLTSLCTHLPPLPPSSYRSPL
jgi:hypothetical protein